MKFDELEKKVNELEEKWNKVIDEVGEGTSPDKGSFAMLQAETTALLSAVPKADFDHFTHRGLVIGMGEGYSEHRSSDSVRKDDELRISYEAPDVDKLSELLFRLSELEDFTKPDMLSRMEGAAERKGPGM